MLMVETTVIPKISPVEFAIIVSIPTTTGEFTDSGLLKNGK